MSHDTTCLPDKDDIQDMGRQVAAIAAAEDKYVYFLLATASALIFVALQRTNGRGFQESQLYLGVAVVCWIASFVAGCVNRQSDISKSTKSFSANTMGFVFQIAMLQVGAEKVAEHPELLEKIERLRKDIDAASKRAHMIARKCYRWQFRLLVIGGIFFIIWHLNEMWLSTSNPTTPQPLGPGVSSRLNPPERFWGYPVQRQT